MVGGRHGNVQFRMNDRTREVQQGKSCVFYMDKNEPLYIAL